MKSKRQNKYDPDEHINETADYIKDTQENGWNPNKFEKFAERNSQHFDQAGRYVGIPLLIAFLSISFALALDTFPLAPRIFMGVAGIISFGVFIYRGIKIR